MLSSRKLLADAHTDWTDWKKVKLEVVRSGRGMGSEWHAAAAGQAPQSKPLDEPPV
jgi:hypothetical protein